MRLMFAPFNEQLIAPVEKKYPENRFFKVRSGFCASADTTMFQVSRACAKRVVLFFLYKLNYIKKKQLFIIICFIINRVQNITSWKWQTGANYIALYTRAPFLLITLWAWCDNYDRTHHHRIWPVWYYFFFFFLLSFYYFFFFNSWPRNKSDIRVSPGQTIHPGLTEAKLKIIKKKPTRLVDDEVKMENKWVNKTSFFFLVLF